VLPAQRVGAHHRALGSPALSLSSTSGFLQSNDSVRASSPWDAKLCRVYGPARFDKAELSTINEIMRQMRIHHPVVGLPASTSANLSDAVTSDNAAVVKRALLTLWDEYKGTPHVSTSPCHDNLLWDRVRVQRLRFQGAKQQYLVVLAAGNTRRLLVLHRPPRHMSFEEARTHVLRQMTYRDNVDGTFEAGRRVKWEVFNEYGIDDAEILRARHGHPLLLIDTSPRHPYGRDLEAREAHVPCRDGRHRVTTQRHIGPAHVRVRFT